MKMCIRICVHSVLYFCRSDKSFEQTSYRKLKYNVSKIGCGVSVRSAGLKYVLSKILSFDSGY
jgi:hypothetical protein